MRTTSVTVTVPVADLAAARSWYEAVFELSGADLEPVEGVAEYEVGGCWVQLSQTETSPAGWVLRFGVPEIEKERRRLIGLGIDVGKVQTEGVIASCDFRDLDGNQISLYTVRSANHR